jgi:hypothetical protein
MFAAVTDLQATVATAADHAEAHATAPALLLQAQSALGQLAALINEATEGGRRPFRIPHGWDARLAELAYLVYLLADQTNLSIDSAVRDVAHRITVESAEERSRQARNNEGWI